MTAASPLRNPPTLVDGFGRRIDYLRLSVTDRCDFRCVYCMPEKMTFLPRDEVLSLDELLAVAEAFVALGVRKIRLTGGEPLVRPGIVELVERIARLPGLIELALTTNGSQLVKLAAPLKRAGLQRLNISLDSLHPEGFRALTRTGNLQEVLAGIEAAQAAGFQRIKLNSVILRGRNDHEVLDLVRFVRQRQLDIAFIEEMPLGVIDEHDRLASWVKSAEILEQIAQHFPLHESAERTGGPSRYYRMADSESRIGVISPHSQNFCASCNRVRVSVQGKLLLCLGNEQAVDLRAVLRRFPDSHERLLGTILAAMPDKPERHHFNLQEPPQIVRFMNMTGG